MEYEIRALTADLVNDYINFFDTEEHSDNNEEHKCYCVCWCSDDHRTGLDKMSSALKRRELAKEYAKNGLIKGYLAYDGQQVVGWCNANEKKECQHCISWLRSMHDVKTIQSSNVRVKSVFCFAVAKDHRKKGIASQLLKRVCEDAKEQGYKYVEAYPKKVIKEIDAFEGPFEMYQKQGFVIDDDFKDYLVVKKYL